MNIIRLGTRFINLDRVIDAEICFDEAGERAVALRYVVVGGLDGSGEGKAAVAGTRGTLMALTVKGEDAAALENYLNECGVVLTTAEPELVQVQPCASIDEGPMPTILEL